MCDWVMTRSEMSWMETVGDAHVTILYDDACVTLSSVMR